MDVFILDLDGTLMPSHVVDNDCYWRAVEAVYGVPSAIPELQGFAHVSDSGILAQWASEQLNRAPTGDELAAIKREFLRLLEAAAADRPEVFQPLPGADAWLERVNARHPVAIATGGWGHTARFKLAHSGLARHALPVASADDAVAREDIMRHALDLLGEPITRPGVTYLGDGPWDARAAAALGWAFIGIASGRRAAKLHAAGARSVHENFLDLGL